MDNNHNRHGASARRSLSSLPPKPQSGQELHYHYLELDISVGDVSLSTVRKVCQDEGKMKACAQVSVDSGNSSPGWCGGQLTWCFF